jgi:hypothetical protein
MNSRRRLLQCFGLGSLFATTGAVAVNQARAADASFGASKFVPHPEFPHWTPRPEFPPYTRTKWKHRVIWVELCQIGKHHRDLLEEILNRETQDGWEFVSMGEGLSREIVFRKRVLWTA